VIQPSSQIFFEEGLCFKRLPERLVLEGYRRWAAGYATGNTSHWNDVWNLYATELGTKEGRHALDALISFVKKTATCAKCPLRMFKVESTQICRDEALILCLISSMQAGDETATELCLSNLACAARCQEVAMEAANFALVLRSLKQTLRPIPSQVIIHILQTYEPSNSEWPDGPHQSKTVH